MFLFFILDHFSRFGRNQLQLPPRAVLLLEPPFLTAAVSQTIAGPLPWRFSSSRCFCRLLVVIPVFACLQPLSPWSARESCSSVCPMRISFLVLLGCYQGYYIMIAVLCFFSNYWFLVQVRKFVVTIMICSQWVLSTGFHPF